MLDIILIALAGIAAGAFTGLVPGIHPNTLALSILSMSPAIIPLVGTQGIVCFLVSAAVSHTFLSFIPSVFIGAPEGGTAMSVLPGHRLLMEGRGNEAVHLTVWGGVMVTLLCIPLLPVLFWLIPVLYSNVKLYLPWILLCVMGVMVLTDSRKLWALLVLGLSGILGIITLNYPVLPSGAVMFPLLTGLFGTSTLLVSASSSAGLPEQSGNVRVDFGTALSGSLKGLVSGIFVGILPGLGAAQAGVMVQQATRNRDDREFLVALGSINTIAAIFSLLALYFISRPRSGVAVAVSKLISLGFNEMLMLVSIALFAAGISAALTLKASGAFSRVTGKVDYRKLSLGVVGFLVVMTALMSGPFGLLVLGAGTAIGLIPPLAGTRRSHCMGCIMVPVVLWLLVLI